MIQTGQNHEKKPTQIASQPRFKLGNSQIQVRIVTIKDNLLSMAYWQTPLQSDSIGLWRWWITHRINGFSDFVHRPDSKELEDKESNPGLVMRDFVMDKSGSWGTFSPRTSVSLANLHSICSSTIIFTITRGWHNRSGVAAVLLASQSRIFFLRPSSGVFYFAKIVAL
jgi:hypothetical protein